MIWEKTWPKLKIFWIPRVEQSLDAIFCKQILVHCTNPSQETTGYCKLLEAALQQRSSKHCLRRLCGRSCNLAAATVLSLQNFSLYPKLKRNLEGHIFESVPAIQRTVTESLNVITTSDFQGDAVARELGWQQCMDN